MILARFAPKDVIELAGDDTVAEHPGPKVYPMFGVEVASARGVREQMRLVFHGF